MSVERAIRLSVQQVDVSDIEMSGNASRCDLADAATGSG